MPIFPSILYMFKNAAEDVTDKSVINRKHWAGQLEKNIEGQLTEIAAAW